MAISCRRAFLLVLQTRFEQAISAFIAARPRAATIQQEYIGGEREKEKKEKIDIERERESSAKTPPTLISRT